MNGMQECLPASARGAAAWSWPPTAWKSSCDRLSSPETRRTIPSVASPGSRDAAQNARETASAALRQLRPTMPTHSLPVQHGPSKHFLPPQKKCTTNGDYLLKRLSFDDTRISLTILFLEWVILVCRIQICQGSRMPGFAFWLPASCITGPERNYQYFGKGAFAVL